VSALLDPLIAQLQAALGSTRPEAPVQTGTPASTNPAQTREMAAQLAKLLSEFDPGAADFVESNEMALSPMFKGESWTQFEKLVQNYSFADAQAQLEEALKQFPPS
jgi:hypothetical protein